MVVATALGCSPADLEKVLPIHGKYKDAYEYATRIVLSTWESSGRGVESCGSLGVVFYVSVKLREAHSVTFHVSGRFWEAQSVVFDVPGRFWEAQSVVFDVS